MKILKSIDINQQDCLQITTEVDEDDVINLYNTYLPFYLKYNQKSLCLRRVNVGYDLYYIAEHIQQCIDHQKMLPLGFSKSIDLGILCNEHTQKIILAEEAGKPLETWSWLGSSLHFLENKGASFQSCETWLYNDADGQIVMQVNTVYPWFYKEAPSKDLEISYDDWLPSYKILYKTIISKNVAQMWIKELNDLYATLELNTLSTK